MHEKNVSLLIFILLLAQPDFIKKYPELVYHLRVRWSKRVYSIYTSGSMKWNIFIVAWIEKMHVYFNFVLVLQHAGVKN